jgi:hypothetical protein
MPNEGDKNWDEEDAAKTLQLRKTRESALLDLAGVPD